MSRSTLRQASAVAFLLLVLVAGILGPGSAAAPAVRAVADEHWSDLARSLAGAAPVRTLLPLLDGGSNLTTGRDGRLTILLLGADGRSSRVGRTDTIIVASLQGKSISFASIPRDIGNVPLPDGGRYSGRINSMVRSYSLSSTPKQAIERFKGVVEFLLQIEIDHYVMVNFAAFDRLVQEIEPIRVNINRAVRDTAYQDDPKKPSGVYFPVADGYEIYAMQPNAEPPLCNGLWKSVTGTIGPQYWCRRAMPFVRSRKGTGNSDFVRTRRAQDLVAGALRRVVARGSGSALTSLRNRISSEAGAGRLYTDLDINASTALDLFRRADGARTGFQVVFSPPRYASAVSGSTAFRLNVAAVRQVAKEHFGGRGGGDIPEPTAPPTPPMTPSISPPASPADTPPGQTPTPGQTTTPGQAATPSPLPTVAPATAAPVTPPPKGPDDEPAFGLAPFLWLTAILVVAFIIAGVGYQMQRRRRRGRGR